MDKTLRLMFLNYTDKPLTFTITFEGAPGDELEIFEMTRPPVPVGDDPKRFNSSGESPLAVTVPPGDIRGCTPFGVVSVVKPATGKFQMYTAAGKDPWPPPPLQAPKLFEAVADFPDRFAKFLTSAGAGVGSNIQMQLEVVPAEQNRATWPEPARSEPRAKAHEHGHHPKDKR